VDSNIGMTRRPSQQLDGEYEILLPPPTGDSSATVNNDQNVIENVRVVTRSSSNPAMLPTDVEDAAVEAGESPSAARQECDPVEPVTLIVLNNGAGGRGDEPGQLNAPNVSSFFVGDVPASHSLHCELGRRVSVSEGDLHHVPGDEDRDLDDVLVPGDGLVSDDDEVNEWDDEIDGGAKEEQYYAELLSRSAEKDKT
jgi:hypothetical protein